jgi:hypothetical protein
MPWFRLDDSFHSHPKVIQAGNEAIGLYVRCGTYAAEHLTDGFVSKEIVALYGDENLAAALIKVKLWHRARGGWTIHDYLDYNPSAQAVDKERAAKAERQKRWLESRRRRVRDASSDASTDGSEDDAPYPPRPAPKEAGRAGPTPKHAANGRASPSGSPAHVVRPEHRSVAEAIAAATPQEIP